MGRSWPSHSAQPLGAKFPVKILTSATNGFDMAIFSPLLVLAGENSLQRDDEIQHQVRAHVFMRLAAAGGSDARGAHGRVEGGIVLTRVVGPHVPSGNRQCGSRMVSPGRMRMRGQLADV